MYIKAFFTDFYVVCCRTPDNWRRGLPPDRPNSRKTSGRKFAILGKIVRMGPCLRPFLAFSSGVRIRPNFALETSFLRYRRPLTGRRCDYTSFHALKSFYRVVEASRVRLQCVLLPFLTRRPKPTCTNDGPCTAHATVVGRARDAGTTRLTICVVQLVTGHPVPCSHDPAIHMMQPPYLDS